MEEEMHWKVLGLFVWQKREKDYLQSFLFKVIIELIMWPLHLKVKFQRILNMGQLINAKIPVVTSNFDKKKTNRTTRKETEICVHNEKVSPARHINCLH